MARCWEVVDVPLLCGHGHPVVGRSLMARDWEVVGGTLLGGRGCPVLWEVVDGALLGLVVDDPLWRSRW